MLLFIRFQCWLYGRRLRKDPDNHLLRGAWGEAQALVWLRSQKRYTLVARNWRWKQYELDAIFWDGPVLVFVEVRTCVADSKQGGVYSVTHSKKASLKHACLAFLRAMPSRAAHTRFDVVEVRYQQIKPTSIRHYEGVPLLG